MRKIAHRFGRARIFSAVVAFTLLGSSSEFAGAIPNPSPAAITFTGSSTLSPPTVTTTVEAGGGITVTIPGLVYPELTARGTEDYPDGYGVFGRFDFLNGSGTSAELKFTATRPFSATAGSATIYTQVDAFFGVDNLDFTPPVGISNNQPTIATLASFTTDSQLQLLGIAVADASYSATASQSIPLVTTSGFPSAGDLEVTNIPTTGVLTSLASGSYQLVQNVTMDFGNLVPGESIDIELPTYSTLDSTIVPEPATAGLVLVGISAVVVRRRR